MTDNCVFYPSIGSERGIGEIFAIDAHAPRGIFKAADENLYLVCDHPTRRFAIVLQHDRYKPFMQIDLGKEALDYAEWLGVGKFCFIADPPSEESDLLEGGIQVADDQAYIVAHRARGEILIAIASGHCDNSGVGFNRWALIVQNQIVLAHDGLGTLLDADLHSAVEGLI